MLLTLTTTHHPATDLGYLLHKNPDRVHTQELPFGTGRLFYPEAHAARCTAALLLEIDPVGLVRKERQAAFALQPYVNDRPYAASSFLSVAIVRMFGTLLSGRSKERPELLDAPLPMEAVIHALPCRGDTALIRELFEPLGYKVSMTVPPLDATFENWGESPFATVTLTRTIPVRELLSHLYVLIPVLDNQKHYFINEEEVDKLLHHGEGWLQSHPKKALITRRYVSYLGSLTRLALHRLSEEGDDAGQTPTQKADAAETALESTRNVPLYQQRIDAITEVLLSHNVRTVLDLGCGEGRLLRRLKQEKPLLQIAGCDAGIRSLEIAKERLQPERQQRHEPEILLFQSALTYRDKRFDAYEALVLSEVIEHIDPSRLEALGEAVFGARPALLIVTTPNREYNVLFETLAAGALRHADHRFEWNREEFVQWASEAARCYGYEVTLQSIGEVDAEHGAPTQMAVFTRVSTPPASSSASS